MHTRELQPFSTLQKEQANGSHNSCTRANCNNSCNGILLQNRVHNSHIRANCNVVAFGGVKLTTDFTIHIYVRIATATYCVSNFNSRICSNSISNIYFVLPILRHILPISYTSLVRISQCFYEYLYFAQGGLCLRPLY